MTLVLSIIGAATGFLALVALIGAAFQGSC
jgi:hypothetical protein